MMTSNFASIKRIPEGMEPVSISRGVPPWYRKRGDKILAPTRAMLALPTWEEYLPLYMAILAQLDPQETYDHYGENAVLLCWCKKGQNCHRRLVANWFKDKLGIDVPEMPGLK